MGFVLKAVKGTARVLRVGDRIHSVALPVARVLGLPCVDKNTGQLRKDSPCASRQRLYNGET